MFGVKPSSIAILRSVGQRYAKFSTEKVPRSCNHIPYSSLVYPYCIKTKLTQKLIQQPAIVRIRTGRPRNRTVLVPSDIPPLRRVATALLRTSDGISPGIVILKIACVVSSTRVGACIAIFSPISSLLSGGDGTRAVSNLAVINAHIPGPHVQDIVAPHERIRVERNMHVHDDPSVGACCVAAIPVVSRSLSQVSLSRDGLASVNRLIAIRLMAIRLMKVDEDLIRRGDSMSRHSYEFRQQTRNQSCFGTRSVSDRFALRDVLFHRER